MIEYVLLIAYSPRLRWWIEGRWVERGKAPSFDHDLIGIRIGAQVRKLVTWPSGGERLERPDDEWFAANPEAEALSAFNVGLSERKGEILRVPYRADLALALTRAMESIANTIERLEEVFGSQEALTRALEAGHPLLLVEKGKVEEER